MDQKSVKLNKVLSCSSFGEFMKRINEWYGELPAFRNYEKSWTYHEIFNMTGKLIGYFVNSTANYIYMEIDSPVYFCVSFFAAIIAGKVVVLHSLCQWEVENSETMTDTKVTALLKDSKEYNFPEQRECSDLAVIAQSSGTTSFTKKVMLSQKNLLSDTVSGMQYYDYPKGAVYYNVLPYTHLFGLVADMLGPLYSGGTICFSSNKFNFFKDIYYFKPTHMNLPPAMVYTMEHMLKKTGSYEVSTGGRLKKIMCAGASLNEKNCEKLKDFGVMIFSAYGLTECSPCISMNCDKFFREGSGGKVLTCCKVRLENGEIIVKGDNVMLGYWNDFESTQTIIHNGWLYTGDMGYMDADGFLYLTGRKSNLIVFEDGKKLTPELLEADIANIPGIKECKIEKKIIEKRTKFNVIIVTDNTNQIEVLKKSVRNCIEKISFLDRLHEIHISEYELPKSELGKMIRRGE